MERPTGENVAWLAEQGLHGVAPNGSLGEYQTLTDEERDQVVRTAVENAPEGFTVMPGVGAYGGLQSKRHAEVARDLGCQAVMGLPPNAYRTDERSLLEHFELIASAGLPVTAYNNPIDTKTDLTPPILAKLYDEGFIVGVKEFSGDVRRYYETKELAPDLDILAGTDDLALEFAIAGSPGWISGYPNALPHACVQLWEEASAGKLDSARELYKTLHPLLRWDSKTEFVQAIKLSMDIVGRYGGPCRPPRVPLTEAQEQAVRTATEHAVAQGLS